MDSLDSGTELARMLVRNVGSRVSAVVFAGNETQKCLSLICRIRK